MAKNKTTVERIVQTKEFLPVRLSEQEVRQHSKRLADLLHSKQQKEAELAAYVSNVKAGFKEMLAEIDKMTRFVNEEVEYRETKVEVHFDFKRTIKVFIRTDTGEVIRESAMRDDEKQLELADVKPNGNQTGRPK